MNNKPYPKFTEGSTAANLDRYRRCIFDLVDFYLNPKLPVTEDQILNFHTMIFSLLDGLGEEIADLGYELGDVEHE